jgi:hypothetical protein
MEDNRGERINDIRTEEATATGADMIAVACPFCMQMFESAVGSVPEAEARGLQVFDLAELLDKSVAYSKPATNGGSPEPPAEEKPSQPSQEPSKAPKVEEPAP